MIWYMYGFIFCVYSFLHVDTDEHLFVLHCIVELELHILSLNSAKCCTLLVFVNIKGLFYRSWLIIFSLVFLDVCPWLCEWRFRITYDLFVVTHLNLCFP